MLSAIMTSLVFITSFLVVLSFLVFFHELGHYSVARFFGVAVERFSIGFGKPLAQWKAKSGTEWSIGRLPLGGYVKFLGDAGAASNPDTEKLAEIKSELSEQGKADQINDVFHFKPVWQRTLIVLAGPVANFILAIAIFAGLALTLGDYQTRSVVTEVVEGGAADKAGLLSGDYILSMNGKDVSDTENLIPYIMVRSGENLETIIERDGRTVSLTVTPEKLRRKDQFGGYNEVGTIGVTLGGADNVTRIDYGPGEAVGKGFERFTGTIATTGTYIGRIFRGKEDGTAFGGPVRIATVTGKTAVTVVNADVSWQRKLKALYGSLFSIAAAISIGLGVANLMPIPALDGGHLLYYGYEAIAGRPLSEEKQEFGFRIGFAVILTLLIYLTINDFGWVQSMSS